MLQKFTYYGVHADVFTQAFFAGNQSANPPDDKVYLYTYLTRLIQFYDDSGVFQTVHFSNDAPQIPRYSLFDFKINQTGNVITQVVWCNKRSEERRVGIECSYRR